MSVEPLRGRPARIVRAVLRLLPTPIRNQVLRHREMLKFLIVGGTCFLVTIAVNYALKLTILSNKPVTALTVATIVTTVLSYILNREWAFRTRGGRERRHEAALFFAVNAIAIGVNDVPLLIGRYVFDLRVPDVSLIVQEISDFGFGIVAGTLAAMAFRFWAYKKWVFPHPKVQLVAQDQGSRAA
ncbi:putative flippase GtrA [Asanoa ferruginea]|uniref:Putative flippase GtrA n=1 Tax=Asanoa ferruginea TaxID=53367 RepID=A0A3D9ZK17_9ACTN|nr:GtrA family protein [Asanoa ferruginea]REF96904.1 putative flippase GtrA [Asanoa ferruginea]GIF49745.1 sugar translocase [Asanoa ferruginea]